MSTPAQRSARAALDAARPAVARLDSSRGTEDLAADIIDTWGAVENALRSLVGSTVLSGQALIREARQRQLINFDQANTLAEFQAVHDRVQNVSYRPTDADMNAARSAFLKLDSALIDDVNVDAPRPAPSAPVMGAPVKDVKAAPAPPVDTGPVAVVGPPPRFPAWMFAAAAAVVIVLAVGGYLLFGRTTTSSYEQGVAAYRAGQREVAVSAFTKATREDPRAPMPHVYLARMAREVGNFTLATQELNTALQAEPDNASALREEAATLLQQGNYELARRFYVRAVQADPTDKMSQGYLGCTLMRLNRVSEATNFLNRAGPGPWSNCTPVAPSSAAGNVAPTGATPPGTTPVIPR